jgi:hypothetical protein
VPAASHAQMAPSPAYPASPPSSWDTTADLGEGSAEEKKTSRMQGGLRFAWMDIAPRECPLPHTPRLPSVLQIPPPEYGRSPETGSSPSTT